VHERVLGGLPPVTDPWTAILANTGRLRDRPSDD
jgi:hypothetical protein